MPSRKRDLEEMEAEDPKQEPSLLEKIRNMWEFASFMQYLFFFAKAVKIDEEFDIEVPPPQNAMRYISHWHNLTWMQNMEAECLKPTHSERLSEIGLALLKYVSSHKGLT